MILQDSPLSPPHTHEDFVPNTLGRHLSTQQEASPLDEEEEDDSQEEYEHDDDFDDDDEKKG